MSLFKYALNEQYDHSDTGKLVTILSSLQPLVLTQDAAAPVTEGAIMIDGTKDLTVYADVVVIRGPLSLPGRSVIINARVVASENDSKGAASAIAVDGADGPPPPPPEMTPWQAAAGKYDAGFNMFPPPPPKIVPPTTGVTPTTAAGTGAAAQDGGSIALYVESFAANCALALSARGGKGGDGQQGQTGGQGGQGYNGCQRLTLSPTHTPDGHIVEWPVETGWNGGDGAQGGNGGPGGDAGPNGAGGTITVRYATSLPGSVTTNVSAGPAGTPGKGGAWGAGGGGGSVDVEDEFPGDHEYVPGSPGPHGEIGPTGGPCKTPAKDGSLVQNTISYDDLALRASPDQRMMTMQLARIAYLSADPSGTSNQGYTTTATLLQWLVNVTRCFSANPAPTPTGFGANEVTKLANIYQEAAGLAFQLSQKLDYYGNPANYVPMGSRSLYQDLLKSLVANLTAIETTYTSYFASFTDQNAQLKHLDGAVAGANAHVAALQSQQSKLQKDADALVPTIDADQVAVNNQKAVLLFKLHVFEEEIIAELKKQQGTECLINTLDELLDATKIIGTVTGDKEISKGAEIGKQVTGLFGKLDPPSSFTDADLEKLIQQLDVLGQDVQNMPAAYTTSTHLITSGAPNAYKVLQEQQDFDTMMQPYLGIAGGQDAIDAMNLYTKLVQQMNSDIVKYNSDIAQVATLTGAIAQAQAQVGQAQEAVAQKTNPALPALVAFMSSLYQTSTALCLYMMYMTYRAESFWSLNSVSSASFFQRIGLNNPAEVNAAFLDTAQTQIISNYQQSIESFGTDAQYRPPFGSSGDDLGIELNLSSDQVQALVKHGETYFALAPAVPGEGKDQTPFAGRANVRILKVRPWVTGAKTRDDTLTARITHTGAETIVDRDGSLHPFTHQPVVKLFTYDLKTRAISGEDADFGQPGTDNKSSYALLGPFTLWRLQVLSDDNSSLDLTGVTGVRVEFWVQNYALRPDVKPHPAD